MVSKESLRSIMMTGFNGSSEDCERLHVVTAATKVTLDDGKVGLLQFHEVAYCGTGPSLLSNAQCRAYGVEVDDCIHFGDLVVRVRDDAQLSLVVQDATCFFRISMPSEEDFDLLGIYTITSSAPWDPTHVGDATGQFGEVPPRLAAMGLGKRQETTDPHILRPYLGHASDEVIRHTLDVTTRLACGDFRIPMRHQRKAPFPQLGVHRLKGAVSTDTTFVKAGVKAIHGYMCGQFMVGHVVHDWEIFGLRLESEGPSALKDYFIEVGVPEILHCDNSQMHLSKTVKELCRCYHVRRTFIEPGKPWQNMSERETDDMTTMARQLMEFGEAPPETWF